MKDFTANLSTGKWRVVVSDFCGLTVYRPTLIVHQTGKGKARLDTFIHETLHASSPQLTEAEVARMAGDIAAVLWQAGYRADAN